MLEVLSLDLSGLRQYRSRRRPGLQELLRVTPRWLPIMLVLAACCAPASADDSPFLLGGIQVNEPDHRQWTSSLQFSGMNTVEATVYAFQGNWDSDHLWWNDEEPAVLAEIRQAKSAGLHVVLVLRLAENVSKPFCLSPDTSPLPHLLPNHQSPSNGRG